VVEEVDKVLDGFCERVVPVAAVQCSGGDGGLIPNSHELR